MPRLGLMIADPVTRLGASMLFISNGQLPF
jgi:hypothetical protein